MGVTANKYARYGNANKLGKAVIGGKKHDRYRVPNRQPQDLDEFVSEIDRIVSDLDFALLMLGTELEAQGFTELEIFQHTRDIFFRAAKKTEEGARV
ncbi:hypothetical protein [Paenibacillus sp. RC84]|uniref:hypothetical protein n=1 Tax=Paenibacillus sp. RC84 TaxID=3156252 RepID=UPI0035190CD1